MPIQTGPTGKDYLFNILTDTATGKVDPTSLHAQIKASPTLTATYLSLTTRGNVLDVFFSAALSGAQQNALVGVVSAHTGAKAPRPHFFFGTGSPNTVQTGNPGDLYLNQAGGADTTLWVKESGVGTATGWVGK